MFFYVSVAKITPKELNADANFISECQHYLETDSNMLPMFAKLGSGKRTLAAQIAIRMAKKDTNLKIKIVGEGDRSCADQIGMSKIILERF